jgi:hypothetical protein
MSSVVRSVLGAALLLTGASAAMAQSANAPVAGQPLQTGVYAATAAPNNPPAPAAGQSVQTAAPNNAPIANQSHHSSVPDNNDPGGGHDPNSTAAMRTFFVPIY